MLRVSLICAAALVVCRSGFAQTGDFERLHSLIKPSADERKWERIPWLTDLWEARRLAAEQGKPIVLWEMDGHPLGCV